MPRVHTKAASRRAGRSGETKSCFGVRGNARADAQRVAAGVGPNIVTQRHAKPDEVDCSTGPTDNYQLEGVMLIKSGHPMMGDEADVAGDCVRFVCDNGRTMFEVRICKGGKSLEVRGVDICKVNGVLYGTSLCVIPHVANVVTVAAIPYDAI